MTKAGCECSGTLNAIESVFEASVSHWWFHTEGKSLRQILYLVCETAQACISLRNSSAVFLCKSFLMSDHCPSKNLNCVVFKINHCIDETFKSRTHIAVILENKIGLTINMIEIT